MYQVIVDLIGEVPPQFTFIYSILTLLLGMLLISFLFQLFYIPINFFRK